ncbi:Fe(3+)-hydroxamate ABC transporter permease FhuB [Teichococcus deserti]|nr:Fe(3+)-hydroxamate ABC transporter permease FhuB [Pseudoroseomonas deserti]
MASRFFVLLFVSLVGAGALFARGALPLLGGDELKEILFFHAALPRLCMALLAGAALGLAGLLFQQVLRNPLAEPGTLGIFAGARLALGLATLGAPGLLEWGQGSIALAGAGGAVGLVLLLAARRGFAPLPVILAGLALGLALEALNKALLLLHYEALSDLALSQAGGLGQISFLPVFSIAPWIAALAAAAFLLRRPLALLTLEDDGARSLGLPLPAVRLAGLAIATGLAATVAATLGGIAGIGLAAPALARAGGLRRFPALMAGSALLGAGLLALTDQALLALAGPGLPAGTLTTLLTAPLLLWLLRRMKGGGGRASIPASRATHPAGPLLLGLALALTAVLALALTLGPTATGGWSFELTDMLEWRGPRVLAALSAGAMLAVAGLVIQRLTGNPMASPELLGLSAGAGLALLLAGLLGLAPGRGAMIALAAAGALAVLALMLRLQRRAGPTGMLLAGLALTGLLGAAGGLLLLTGDPRLLPLLGWLAGSTYAVTAAEAWTAFALAAILLPLSGLAVRWLSILPLGVPTGTALGLPWTRLRPLLLGLAALLTGAATLLVGPLSFVGLMAPHLCRMIGLRGTAAPLAGAALSGALVMTLADWLGRSLAFPWQLPAGLVATLLGSAYLLGWMLRR